MGRLKRESLNGLAELGARLRAIREGAGLSQMRVSELMGFNPTHGYKYILRLEKGTVPNPTFRTIIGFIEVCGADWPDLLDVLPHAGFKSGARPRPGTDEPAPSEPEPATPPAPRRRDPRPLRVRLREERLAERERRTRELWTAVTGAETVIAQMLQDRRVPAGSRRDYLALIRPVCSTLQAFGSARPRVVEVELTKLAAPAVERGLDPAIIEEVIRLCRESMAGSGTTGS